MVDTGSAASPSGVVALANNRDEAEAVVAGDVEAVLVYGFSRRAQKSATVAAMASRATRRRRECLFDPPRQGLG